MEEGPSLNYHTRVVHLSSVHPANDVRILFKECGSLAGAGYNVAFVVPTDDAIRRNGVEIVPVKRRSGRLSRFLGTTIEVASAGWRFRGKIYHFHDPELIPIGILFQALGKSVVYDVHEDLPRAIIDKDWIPPAVRRPVAVFAELLEWIAGHSLSAVIAATPLIARRFPAHRTVLVQNFPPKTELASHRGEAKQERRLAAYVGGLTAIRGAAEMVRAMAQLKEVLNARLVIAGSIGPPDLLQHLAGLPGWSQVDYRGWLGRAAVRQLLAEARVGLVLFHPLANHVEAQPTKLFEYMSAGVPVIASDFPLWREVVVGHQCGLCVPPNDVAAIASAIEWMFEHPGQAHEMGKRGRALVLEKFNWEREEQKLIALYQRLAGNLAPEA